MLSLWLIPLGFYALSRGKTKTYSKPISIRTGLIFDRNKIEIINRTVAFNLIDSSIRDFARKQALQIDDISIIDVFEHILQKLNCDLYLKMISKKLSQKEKMIIGLFFVLVFNRVLVHVKEPELFIENFHEQEERIINYMIGLSQNDQIDLENIEERFRVEYSYP